MRLSSDYRRVAIFESQPGGVQLEESSKGVSTEFRVGPFLYRFTVDPINERGVFAVGLELTGLQSGSDEELVKIISQFEKRPVSLEEAKSLEGYITMSYGDVPGLGEGYAVKVLGTMLGLVQQFVEQQHPKCLIFTSGAENRTGIYSKMVKRFFPSASIRTKVVGGGTTRIRVCLGR